jgi:hypothetical protein
MPFVTPDNTPRPTCYPDRGIAISYEGGINLDRIASFNLSQVSGFVPDLTSSFYQTIAKSLNSLVACLTL